ncbi:glycoside hydrolase family 38 C-terminal domain-containing protein [Olivibacter sp. CPCC 100613]|uniref:glycoside hydrolase family 38 C-terminal domain-containing protein n=1 Tax=Olivibacter sp. CPCC 100613 TaxID=3079931 RepID=UPI002FFA2EE3
MKNRRFIMAFLLGVFLLNNSILQAQKVYFVDGYHGGKWGHYPSQYTRFIMDQLQQHRDWKLNLEIEPETWDWVKGVDPEGYERFAALIKDQSDTGRMEYVNPTYGQPYLYNISGESIIRQFAYGIALLRKHFPTIRFDTYSSEEPCFTSALPQILTGFGIKYASLKNPNTCWGGYTRAYGKEMVDWVGPDGTSIPTVPRYEMEALKPGSTWETIASYNSENFVQAAFDAGIEHPLGMCLQDAGWKNGPWLGTKGGDYQPTVYTTWRHYFEQVSTNRDLAKWRLSQEDIQVSLVWGAQVLQRIAQQVRKAEQRLLMAEKWAAMDRIWHQDPWPEIAFQRAWHPLLLAQHHDCWIVPYNKVDSVDWAGKVKQWTGAALEIADSVIAARENKRASVSSLMVRNVLPYGRNGVIDHHMTDSVIDTNLVVVDPYGKEVLSQWSEGGNGKHLLFEANVPAMGEKLYHMKKGQRKSTSFAQLNWEGDELIIKTDNHLMRLNANLGGVMTSLKLKDTKDKEWVDTTTYKGFNELRGFFYDQQRFRSSTENKASIKIIEKGAIRLRLAIEGKIAGHDFTQEISLTKGEPRIDVRLKIDWNGKVSIGQFDDEQLRLENREKAFYNDQYKLLLLFPAKLEGQRIAKNAPFDVTESRLDHTFFSSWDHIKNNVLLDWVDVTDQEAKDGLALFTDHTTSYAHGREHPLALNVQYVGKGLWGRDYCLDGPTELNYSLLPHQGNWAKAALWQMNEVVTNPLQSTPVEGSMEKVRSLFDFSKPGYQLTAMQYDQRDLLLRIFNAAGDEGPMTIHMKFPVKRAQLENLNQEIISDLTVINNADSTKLELQMPRFGFRTIRIKLQ